MIKKRAVAKEQRPSTKLDRAVSKYRTAHARLFTKCMALAFARLHSHMRAAGIDTDNPVVQAAIEGYGAGDLGFDRDPTSEEEEARVTSGFFELCGFTGPDFVAEAVQVARQPWRRVVGDLVRSVDELLLAGHALKLDASMVFPLHELLSQLCVELPGHREINPCKPNKKAMDLAERGLAVCSRMLAAARSRAGGDGELSGNAVQVLLALPPSDSDYPIHSLSEISAEMRCDRSTVSRGMKELTNYAPPLAVSARRNYRRTLAGDREAGRRGS